LKEITVALTETQENFLKKFAEKQYEGAEDNLLTANALHVVENKRYFYIPYSSDLTGHFEDLPLTFTYDQDYECWWDNETELIKDYYTDYKEEDCPIEIKPFSEVSYSYFTTVDGEEDYIINWEEYFEAYGIKIHAMAWKKHYWEKAAYFFIRDEAKKYIEYQKHNLTEPRIYTYSAGYANYGDFIPFRDLLMTMGKQLNV
jgi:hypothetical protein